MPAETKAKEERPADASAQRASLVPHACLLLAATALFSAVARAMVTKRTRPTDERVRAWMHEHRSDVIDVAVKPVTLLSLPMLAVSTTALLACWLKSQGRGRAALTVALIPVLASSAGQSFTTFLPQQNPPDRELPADAAVVEASFPSGHVTGVMAEALTIGYILLREEIGSPEIVAALAAWPMVVAITRVYRDRHWASDVIGALLAGTAVAALTTMFYESGKTRSAPTEAS